MGAALPPFGQRAAPGKGPDGTVVLGGSGARWAAGQLRRLRAGSAVQFFFAADLRDGDAGYLCPRACVGVPLRQSHGWLDGTLAAAFAPEAYDPGCADTWPLVRWAPGALLAQRRGGEQWEAEPLRVPLLQLREPVAEPPLLSLVLVRWDGEHALSAGTQGEGGWGSWGAPPSDAYLAGLVERGMVTHPELSRARAYDFEVFSLFVRDSRDVGDLASAGPWVRAALGGLKKTVFWMVWPAEWEDSADAYYSGYVGRAALFGAMRAFEGAGLHSGFPHGADLYERITSKTWMASLCLAPEARLPAAALVGKGAVVRDAAAAARQALAALERIRAQRSRRAAGGALPELASANRSSIRKGVVKLGWSWEARYVKAFVGEEQLRARMLELLCAPGCSASTCVVQEWVDFDFEMRLYFVPPAEWDGSRRLDPVRFEGNCWFEWGSDGRPHTFRRFDDAKCVEFWQGDAEALRSAKQQAVEISQFLLTWLLSVDARPVPMIRLDFMLRRVEPGTARVVFGEYCEMGACCLSWRDGPPTTWRAALDGALRWGG